MIEQKKVKAVTKIKEWYKKVSEAKQRYSVKVILYKCFDLKADLDELCAKTNYSERINELNMKYKTKDNILTTEEQQNFSIEYEEIVQSSLKKVEEMYKRKHFKFFYKYIAVYSHESDNFKINKVMYAQKFRPCSISIKMSRNEFDKYHAHYTYKENVLKDKYKQLVFDSKGKLSKPKEKISFENTPSEWNRLISICRKDSNFNENYNLYGSYYSAMYLFDAISDLNKNDYTEPFNIFDTDMYKIIDNNGICFKNIDYTINKNATEFKDLFQFEQTNKNILPALKANSCYFNLIYSTYKEAIENVYQKEERVYKDITPESLCKILCIENKEQDLGLSIRASIKFFEKFNLGLTVLNIYDDVIFKYIPPTRHKRIHPETLYILVYNNHCFKLNSHVKSFVKKISMKEVIDEDKETYENLKNKLSTRFCFRNFDKESNKIFIDKLDDTVSHIKNNSESKSINFITNTDLTEILFEMVDNKYTPYVTFESGILSKLGFKLKQNDEEDAILYSIQHGDSSMVTNEIMTVEQDEIVNYDKADRAMYEWLLNKNNMSQRNDYVRNIENKYQIGPLSGFFEGCELNSSYNTVDINKSYTSDLIDVQNFPVFSVFDIFLKYDGHKIEDYTQYIVRCDDNNVTTSILFRKTYSRCYGYKLNRISNVAYTILYYRKPSRLNKANSNAYIDDLYSVKICENEQEDIEKKKFIANKNMGLIEKKYNSASITKIYKTLIEAQYYQIKYGGYIYKLSDHQLVNVDVIEEQKKDGVIASMENKERVLYVLVNNVKKDLEESFNPIKDLIYDIQLLKLWKLYNQLSENNIVVYGIKTDCLLVKENKDILSKFIVFDNKIGGVKFESCKIPINKKITMFKNELIEFKQPEVNVIKLNDEYDVVEMRDKLQKYDRVLMKGLLPGSGKTTSVKNSGYNLEFITPFNKLCQELRKENFNSVTLNKLLNINIMGEYNKKAKQHDISQYEAICFDEIPLYGPHYLSKIYNFMNKSDKKIFATGDVEQLQPIGFQLNNVSNVKEYMNRILDIMFPNQIILEHNKRLNTIEDQLKLKQIKEDIFNMKIDVGTTMRKYFKTIHKYSELQTVKNISFFNFRAEIINKHIQEKYPIQKGAIQKDKFWYYEGLELICKKHYKAKDIRLYTNYSYILQSIDEKKFTILEPVDNVKMTLNSKLLSHFKLPHCLTCHSVQGLSIDDKVTLFDCNTPYVDRHFVWTAITRVRDLNNITYFEHSDNEVQALEDSRLKQYLKLKIDGYKKQDIEAKRCINKEMFIDINWFCDQVKTHDRCPMCNYKYYYVIDERNDIRCNISVDRLDNSLAHEKENCHLLCIECNKCKR